MADYVRLLADVQEAINEIGRLEVELERKDDLIAALEDKLEAKEAAVFHETDCKRCGRMFRSSGSDYCTKDCELGYTSLPFQVINKSRAASA